MTKVSKMTTRAVLWALLAGLCGYAGISEGRTHAVKGLFQEGWVSNLSYMYMPVLPKKTVEPSLKEPALKEDSAEEWEEKEARADESYFKGKTEEAKREEYKKLVMHIAEKLGREGESWEDLELLGALGTQLEAGLKAYQAGEKDWAAQAGIPSKFVKGDKLLVHVVGEEGREGFAEAVRSTGAKVLYELSGNEIEAEVSMEDLEGLARVVGKVNLPGEVRSEAFTGAWGGTNARWWQLAGRVTGNGGPGGRPIKIAIIDEFDPSQFRELETQGLIPVGTAINREFNPPARSKHGNHMLALAYEIAPRAEFILINRSSEPSMGVVEEEINHAISLRADIINLSLSTPIDRKNSVASPTPGWMMAAENRAAAAGILVVAAAGNHAVRGVHWSGNFIPSTSFPSYLDWNSNADTAVIRGPGVTPQDLPSRSQVTGERIVNDVGCMGANPQRGMGVSIGLPSRDSRLYFVEIRRYDPTRQSWIVVQTDFSPGATAILRTIDHSVNPFAPLPSSGGSPIRYEGTTPPTNCPAGQARYGISIERATGTAYAASNHPENYINLFYYGNETGASALTIYNTASSLSESNTSPSVVTVGAAFCTVSPGREESPEGCLVGDVTSYSSRGPVVRDGMKPTEWNRTYLTDASRDETSSSPNLDAVKPDFVTASPPVTGENDFSGGTSSSTAITSGMAALLMDRYPDLRNNVRDMRAALNRLSERGVGNTSLYPRRSDDPNNRDYLETLANYKYGRGYLKLERENSVVMRGTPNHVRLNAPLTSSPALSTLPGRMGSPSSHNGSETYQTTVDPPTNAAAAYRYGDGMGPAVALYFNGVSGLAGIRPNSLLTLRDGQAGAPTRLLFPVLKPYVEFTPTDFGGQGRAVGASMIRASVANHHTQPFPSAAEGPRKYLGTLRQAGYFIFDSISFTRNPWANPNIGQGYRLTLRAARRDGSLLATSSREALEQYLAANIAAENRTSEIPPGRDSADPLTFGCPDCYIGKILTSDFNVCSASYNPPEVETCPQRAP